MHERTPETDPSHLVLVAIDRLGEGLPQALAPRDPALAMVRAAALDLYARRGYQPPWIGYLAFIDGVCVGSCGFAAPPADGSVEIAYFCFPHFEGRRIASTMARRLLDLVRAVAPEIRPMAHTLPHESASTRILRRLGFHLEGTIEHPEDGQVWKWTWPNPAGAGAA